MVEPRLDQDPPERGRGMRVRVAGGLEALELARRQPREIRLQRGERHLLLHLLPRLDDATLFSRGEDRARGRLLADVEREQAVRHHQPPHGLRGVRGPHRHDGDVPAVVASHLPDGLLGPLAGSDGLPRAGLRVEAREVEDPVPQGADAGHHRGPDERRQVRLERAENAGAALPHQPLEVRHRPVRPVRVEQLPVRGVEADDDHPARGRPQQAPVHADRRHDADGSQPGKPDDPSSRDPPRVGSGFRRPSPRRCRHQGARCRSLSSAFRAAPCWASFFE